MRYKFEFDRSSKKFICPNCKKKSFVRYLDSETKRYTDDQFGKCDRASKCNHHNKPNNKPLDNKSYKYSIPASKPFFIPSKVLNDTFKHHEDNNLIKYLNQFYETTTLVDVISQYKIGTITVESLSMCGATTFPYIDVNNNCRAIQIRQYNSNNGSGKNLKQSFIQWLYKSSNWFEEYQKQDTKISCFFGEHLLSIYPSATVLVVEAPKTAIIFACEYGIGKYVCLSAFNLEGLRNLRKAKALEGRKVVFIPDTSKDSRDYNIWLNDVEAIKLKYKGNFKVIDFLENIDSKNEGDDLADFLLRAS